MFLSLLALLQSLSLAAAGAAVLLCLSALLIKRMLAFTGISVYLCVILWTVSLCLWCGANVYQDRGLALVIVGVLFGGVGVVPIAFLSFLFSGKWREILELLFQFGLVLAGNLVAPWMLEQDWLRQRGRPNANADLVRRLAQSVIVRTTSDPIRATAITAVRIPGRQESRARK